MESLRFLGFLCVGLIVLIGLDYYKQDTKTDGQLSLSGYVDNVNQRFNRRQDQQNVEKVARERQKRWDAGPKPYFPEPLQGWTRHALTDTGHEAVSTALSLFVPAEKIAFDDAPPQLTQMMDASRERQMRQLERTSALYANGTDLILLNVAFKEKSSRNTVAGLAISGQTAVMESMKKKEGYAVVDGVAFVEELKYQTNRDEVPNYRVFTGRIGFDQEVIISLHTNANDDAIRDMLDAVDYAGMNALLPLPALVVGKGIEVPLDQQPEIADSMMALYDRMKQTQTDLGQEKIRNMDPSAVVINTLAGSGFETEGLVDITGGEVFENQELMQLTYNRTQGMLLMSALRSDASEPGSEASGAGAIESLMTQEYETSAPAAASAQAEVTVRKGGAGESSCAVIGNTKRCSVDDN